MNIYTHAGIPMIHISDFAYALNRSVTSTRNLIDKGNSIRKLKAFRDKSRLMIPYVELTGFPFVLAGPTGNGKQIFHYRVVKAEGAEEGVMYQRYMCPECTYGNKCKERIEADALVCPKGDA